MSKLKTTAAQRQAINDRYRNKYSWMAGPGPDLLDDVGTLLAENDRLRKQIKHHENSERFWRENILDPSDKTDDRLQEDCEYVAGCTCGLCLFVRHLLSVRAENAALKAERDAASAAMERDRSKLAGALTTIKRVIASRSGLIEGRGCYEWDDDRYREEFRQAITEVAAAVEPLNKIAADWTGCPEDAKAVAEARRDYKAERDALTEKLQNVAFGVGKMDAGHLEGYGRGADCITIADASGVRKESCPDCARATKTAYSDRTTPGFFSPLCPKHAPKEGE